MSILITPSAGRRAIFLLLLLSALLLQGLPAVAQFQSNSSDLLSIQPRDRITGFIDDEQRVVLRGNVPPLASPQFDMGPVESEYRMERMVLTLQQDAAQLGALSQFMGEQSDPESPYYHQWLTPEKFGASFGASVGDVEQITRWLEEKGFEVEESAAGSLSVSFSGTAEQVESAFHTQIHLYQIGQEVHHANASDPEIPAALAPVVAGIVSLHDFRSQLQNTGRRLPVADFTSGSSYYLAPGDFSTIYNLAPLYQQSITGNGEAVAIVARSNINIADVRQFRSAFDLPVNDPQIIVNGSNPGIWSTGEETEADLDVEWAGAVAKGAAIKFVVSQSTNASDGVDLSALYIVSHNLAPVMTVSFGLCEAALGSSGNTFLNNLWRQAAAQGITVLVSSGDNGAAGCDSASAARATHGLGVNGLCSTPYSVCVGGTEFADSNSSLYWSGSNVAGTESSALSYIPEVAWNESGAEAGLWSTGGGASLIYTKPAWQLGTGVPRDGKRDVPDVSLTAASHDGYLIYQNGGLYVVGGTSAASPSFAGLMALIVQNSRSRQGNPNPVLYSLAAKQRAGGAAVFHDITIGNNSVPGQAGFNAAEGYDRATGLGSVNAALLAGHWGDATATARFEALLSETKIALADGTKNSISITISINRNFNSPVALSAAHLPSGVSGSFSLPTLTPPGSGTSVLQLTATPGAKAGIYSLLVVASGGGITQQIPFSLTVMRR
jgi:subtilase family serine protease